MPRILFVALSLCGALLLMPPPFIASDAVADPATGTAGLTAAIANTPVGTWLRADGRTVFGIETCATGLCGRIVGFAIDNPNDPAPIDWRGEPLCGEQIITVTPEYGIRNKWHGSIINPRNGNVWQASLTLVNGTLQLRGYFGLPLFGRTESWTPFTGQIGPRCRIMSAG